MDPEDEIRVSLLPNSTLGPRSVSACVLAEGITNADKQRRSEQTQRKLLFALAIAFLFMLIEVSGGIWAHSLAIITDAAHLLSDVSGFAVSAAAAYYSTKKSHSHYSYGYHRIEVLGALASVLTVWLVTGILLWEAIYRIRNPEPVDGKIMTIIALIGVAVNIALMAILGGHGHSHHGGGGNSHSGHTHGTTATDLRVTDHHAEEPLLNDGDHHHNQDTHSDDDTNKDHASFSSNINIRGAVIHVIGDLVQSIGVVIAGGLIWYHQDDPRWALADPICTFFFAALVLFTTFSLLSEIGNILMERAPHGADVEQAYNDLLAIEGVENIFDFHIWSLTPGIPLLCAHIATTAADPVEVLRRVTLYCRKELGIEHTTIQIVVAGADTESRHESEATLVAAV